MNTTSATTESACLESLQYISASGTCLIEFTNILNSSHCSTDPEDILVTVNEEATTKQLIDGLTTVGASIECKTKAIPFLCLHLFGLCGELGFSIQPTIDQCEEIRDTVCPREWKLIEQLGFPLPDCAMLPRETLFCPAPNVSVSSNETSVPGTVE